MKLSLDQVVKEYDNRVLDHLTVDLDGHQAIAIIGPSGCGKSTLLRLLAGIERPQAGRIQVGDWLLTEETIPAYQKTIGFVFQTHNLFPHLSLKRNITLILEKTRGFSAADASDKADSLLTLLRLQDEQHKKPAQVSGGQAQRAAIARALCLDPDLLLLDEPTASLDPVLTHEVLSAVQDLRSLGKNFIFVTHEIAFVRSFADYVLFLDQGRIIEHGKSSLLQDPKTEGLRAFLEHVAVC